MDQHEDRLTEVFAAVLSSDHSEGLARHVALGWLAAALKNTRIPINQPLEQIHDLLSDDGTAWACEARTQIEIKTSEGRRRPDLELIFTTGDERRPNVTVWVEVKHGTKPHDHQLQAYLETIRRVRSRYSVLVLVAPHADLPTFEPDQIPEEVPQLTWEATASRIESFETADPVGRFLRDELFAYLRKEKLVDPGPLTPQDLESFATYYDARRSLVGACEIAAEEMVGRWGDGKPDYWHHAVPDPSSYWWSYDPTARDGTSVAAPPAGWDLQWQLALNAQDVVIDGPAGVPLLTAGLVGEPDALQGFIAEELENLRDRGFEVLTAGLVAKGWNYIGKTSALDSLELTGKSLRGQGEIIAIWVDGTFRALADALRHGPGASAAGQVGRP